MSTATLQRPQVDLGTRFAGRYLSVTTFRRDGSPVATPVWFVADGERLLALTDLHSGKVKRIRRNPQVLVAACGPSGKLRTGQVPAHAEVLTDTADLDRAQRLLTTRYRISYPVIMFFYRLGRRLQRKAAVADGAAIAITLT